MFECHVEIHEINLNIPYNFGHYYFYLPGFLQVFEYQTKYAHIPQGRDVP